MKKVLVIGASEKPNRYSNLAIRLLNEKGHETLALGKRPGEVDGITIDTGHPEYEDVDSVTMYIGARNQPEYYDYIKSLRPKRVIFNPGAENPDFSKDLNKAGIETENACTLVLLNTGTF